MTNHNRIKRELKNSDALEACAAEFGIIGDRTRLKICYLLCRYQELSVGEIARLLGVSISAVSRTLQKLERAGLIRRRREHRTVYIRLNRSPLATLVKQRLNAYETF
ncbi:MAG: winged helix-turn-helix transcriptional regulator [Candidatus Kerfeldbacteria bacterium]|nr:winged helix-turn-helix transcriptional regulator [Candidatus Kerfeldbacteria bacterium]